ncbi:MAG TPA: hypothetical protein VNO32_52430, partial [Candidatus Acidoferrum sp.]|nr:hypothetical protein [Candidatus Acidoferrum sp.]
MTFLAASAFPTVLAHMANSALRAVALSGVAGLGLAAFRVKTTALRLFTWTAVLYAALAMPVLQWVLPTVMVPTPAVLQFGAAQSPGAELDSSTPDSVVLTRDEAARTSRVAGDPSNVGSRNKSSVVVTPSADTSSPAVRSAPLSPNPSSIASSVASLVRWSTVAAVIYLGVVSLFLVRFFVGLAFGRRLLRASQQIDDPRVVARLASRTHASGLGSVPRAAESELISVPLTMGVWRATILL